MILTKDTRDKNKDEPSRPLSCCIPDIPSDEWYQIETFRASQGGAPGYVEKFSWSLGPWDMRYGNQIKCILLGFSWSTGSLNQSISKHRHIFHVCSTTLIFCSTTKLLHISLQNKSQRYPLRCHACCPFSCVTPKSLSRKNFGVTQGRPVWHQSFSGKQILTIRNLQTPKSLVPVDQISPKFFHTLLRTSLSSPENFSSIAEAEVP